jgi:hypothetical protein
MLPSAPENAFNPIFYDAIVTKKLDSKKLRRRAAKGFAARRLGRYRKRAALA